jgi:hypothetical protein
MSSEARRQRTDSLRAIPLTVVLRAAGATTNPHDAAKWHTGRGVLSVNGAKFFNWNEARGGGGAIDLAMHLIGTSFSEALDWLAHLPSASQGGILRPSPSDQPARARHRQPPALPTPVADALPTVLRYLNRQRRLPLDLLCSLIDSGDLYADRRANAVFILRDDHNSPVGAELRGTGPRCWRGMAPGSRKDRGYFALAPLRADAVMLCESAIDAISCRVLHPNALCVSTSGARPNPAWVPTLIATGLPVYCAFDTDPTGQRMARAMIVHHPTVQRLCPPAHDWNDALRAHS